jgi:hypothetical protein
MRRKSAWASLHPYILTHLKHENYFERTVCGSSVKGKRLVSHEPNCPRCHKAYMSRPYIYRKEGGTPDNQ